MKHIHLHKDDGEEQVKAVLGSVVLLPRRGPAPPTVREQHPPLPPPLLLLRHGGREGGVGGGAEPVKGEDFGATPHRGPRKCPGPSQSHCQLLAPLLQGQIFLLDANDGEEGGGEAPQAGVGAVCLFLIHFSVMLRLLVHLVHLSVRLRR